MNQQLQEILQVENEKLKKENELMRTIATADGFYNYFFKISLEFKTRKEAFDHLNDLYFNLFGCYRYSCYDSFRIISQRK